MPKILLSCTLQSTLFIFFIEHFFPVSSSSNYIKFCCVRKDSFYGAFFQLSTLIDTAKYYWHKFDSNCMSMNLSYFNEYEQHCNETQTQWATIIKYMVTLCILPYKNHYRITIMAHWEDAYTIVLFLYLFYAACAHTWIWSCGLFLQNTSNWSTNNQNFFFCDSIFFILKTATNPVKRTTLYIYYIRITNDDTKMNSSYWVCSRWKNSGNPLSCMLNGISICFN